MGEERGRAAPGSLRTLGAHAAPVAERAWRRLSVAARPFPDFVIVGAQRGGTTSLYDWLSGHPAVAPASRKEVHYFDLHYGRGPRWYRAHFPVRRPGLVTGEATPYLLFHPLAPERVARDLPARTRFVVVLRDPVQRAVSHYWHERRLGAETEPLAKALALEEGRLAGSAERVLRGEPSYAHLHFAYAARGRYAEQLRRWYAHVEQDRILVVESEQLFRDPAAPGRVARWLGLADHAAPFPTLNDARRADDTDASVLASLRSYFAPYNEELFALLGTRLWEGDASGG